MLFSTEKTLDIMNENELTNLNRKELLEIARSQKIKKRRLQVSESSETGGQELEPYLKSCEPEDY